MALASLSLSATEQACLRRLHIGHMAYFLSPRYTFACCLSCSACSIRKVYSPPLLLEIVESYLPVDAVLGLLLFWVYNCEINETSHTSVISLAYDIPSSSPMFVWLKALAIILPLKMDCGTLHLRHQWFCSRSWTEARVIELWVRHLDQVLVGWFNSIGRASELLVPAPRSARHGLQCLQLLHRPWH